MRPDYLSVKQNIYTANALDTLRLLEPELFHPVEDLVQTVALPGAGGGGGIGKKWKGGE